MLVAAFAAGVALPVDPDLDATFGLEAYRPFGWTTFVPAAAALLAVLFVPALARGIEASLASAARPVPGVWRAPLAAVALTGVFVALTDTSLPGDGMGVLLQACQGDVSASSPLTSWLQIAAVRALPLDPRDALRFLSCAAGAAYVLLAMGVARMLFARPADRAATAVLLVTCGGAAVFFGSVEIYALPACGTLAFLALVVRRMDGTDTRPWPPLALGLLVTLHGSTLALLPVAAYATWRAPGARRDVRSVATAAAAFAAPVAAAVVLLFLTRWGGALPDPSAGDAGNVLGAQGQAPLLPVVPTSFTLTHRYAVLGAEHLAGIGNLLVLLAPVGALLALAGRGRGPRVTAAFLAVAGLAALALVWNVSYSLRRDWDLFATLGVALSLLGAVRFLGAELPGRAVRVVALALFAFMPLVFARAGDTVQRRRYVDEILNVYGWIAESDDLAPPAVRDRVLRHRERWEAEERRLDPRRVESRTRAAWRALERGDLDRAEVLADELLEREPDNAAGLHARGEVLYERGRLAEARELLERSLRVAREDLRPRTRRMLSRIARDEGNRAEAIRQLERGLREEVAWAEEGVALLRELAAARRAAGELPEAEWAERMAQRREREGLK